MTYVASEKYALAEEPLRRACTLDPREESACYYLGRTYFTLGRLEQSRQAYEEALRHAGGDGRVLLIESWNCIFLDTTPSSMYDT